LIRRIVQLIYKEKENGRALEELLKAHEISAVEFAQAESENHAEKH